MCAIIPHIKLPPDICFKGENRNFFDFRVNTQSSFSELGSRKRFHASGMRAIDYSHRKPPYGYFRKKYIIFWQKFGRKIAKIHVFEATLYRSETGLV